MAAMIHIGNRSFVLDLPAGDENTQPIGEAIVGAFNDPTHLLQLRVKIADAPVTLYVNILEAGVIVLDPRASGRAPSTADRGRRGRSPATASPLSGRAPRAPTERGQAEEREQRPVVVHDVVGAGVAVGLRPLAGREHDRPHPGPAGAVDVAVHVVADVDGVLGGDPEIGQRVLEQPPVGLAVPVVAGDDDRVEVPVEPDGCSSARAHALWPSVTTASGKRAARASSTVRTYG